MDCQVNFLIKGAASLSYIQNNKTRQILKSYYLLQCRKLTGKFGLPQRHFSENTRCQCCLLEWEKETLNPIKLTKRQRQRIKSKNKKKFLNKEYLLRSNEMESICSFCGHTRKTIVQKPSKPLLKNINSCNSMKEDNNTIEHSKICRKQNIKNKHQTNIAFSLSKKISTLSNLIKEPAKVIKNNKKKKDKFAGLCRTAVITASKLKHVKEENNKLNLFLRPAT